MLPKERFRTFASDPIRHCALLQEEIMRSRFEGWRDLSSAPRLIFDRSLDEDAHVFCRMHRELGLLDDQQYEQLQDLARKLQAAMPGPDLIIFMCPERRVLSERVTQPAHPSLIVQSLDRQLSLYTEWLATRREDVLRLDNSACSLRTVQRLFSEGPFILGASIRWPLADRLAANQSGCVTPVASGAAAICVRYTGTSG